jgi:hypothetical protein
MGKQFKEIDKLNVFLKFSKGYSIEKWYIKIER